MPGAFMNEVQGFRFWDSTGAGNGIARYSAVSLASAAEVAAANAAGVSGNVGEIVVQAPVAAGFTTRRVVGITNSSARNGQDIVVITGGVAWVQVSAAVALDSVLFGALAETRTSAQTPFVDVEDMRLANDPIVPITYNLVLADDTALPAANTLHYPIGFALKAAVAKYDIIPVDLQLGYMR